MLEPDQTFEQELGLEVSDTLLRLSVDGLAQAVVVNTSGFTQRVAPGTMMGQAEEVIVVDGARTETGGDLSMEEPVPPSCEIMKIDVSQDCTARKCKLLEIVGRPELLNDEQVKYL